MILSFVLLAIQAAVLCEHCLLKSFPTYLSVLTALHLLVSVKRVTLEEGDNLTMTGTGLQMGRPEATSQWELPPLRQASFHRAGEPQWAVGGCSVYMSVSV